MQPAPQACKRCPRCGATTFFFKEHGVPCFFVVTGADRLWDVQTGDLFQAPQPGIPWHCASCSWCGPREALLPPLAVGESGGPTPAV